MVKIKLAVVAALESMFLRLSIVFKRGQEWAVDKELDCMRKRYELNQKS